jgi:hypothetical protein
VRIAAGPGVELDAVVELLLWISPRDMAQLVLRSIEADSMGFLTAFGVSNNTPNPYERAGWEQLGYRPEDDLERWVRTTPDLMGHPTRASDPASRTSPCLPPRKCAAGPSLPAPASGPQ